MGYAQFLFEICPGGKFRMHLTCIKEKNRLIFDSCFYVWALPELDSKPVKNLACIKVYGFQCTTCPGEATYDKLRGRTCKGVHLRISIRRRWWLPLKICRSKSTLVCSYIISLNPWKFSGGAGACETRRSRGDPLQDVGSQADVPPLDLPLGQILKQRWQNPLSYPI